MSSPTNDAIADQVRRLQFAHTSEPPEQVIRDCVQLLQALDIPSLTAPQREKLLAPGTDSQLHRVCDLYYNDLGSRALRLESPNGRIQVHYAVPHDLCAHLHISSLGSLHMHPLELDTESMREDLTTRIGNVLRSYNIDQAFNEFLANAADAGAKKFNIMLDCGDDRRADPSEILCQNMAQFCQGPAVIAHNDAEFTMDDIRGICRIGRGGKEDRDGMVGRFGLGALSFYHFSEVRSLWSAKPIHASNVNLPITKCSGCNDPFRIVHPVAGPKWELSAGGCEAEFVRSTVASNEEVRPLVNRRIPPYANPSSSLYPGHLKLFQGLFGFQVEHPHYNGVSFWMLYIDNLTS